MTYESERRACPHCGKAISAKATRCKYCLEELLAMSSPASSSGTTCVSREDTVSDRAAFAPTHADNPSVSRALSGAHQYRVVPFLGAMKSGLFSNDSAHSVSAQLQNLIDQHAQQGWEFYSLEKVNIQINPGCIGQLLGQSASFITSDQVIFRRPIQANGMESK